MFSTKHTFLDNKIAARVAVIVVWQLSLFSPYAMSQSDERTIEDLFAEESGSDKDKNKKPVFSSEGPGWSEDDDDGPRDDEDENEHDDGEWGGRTRDSGNETTSSEADEKAVVDSTGASSANPETNKGQSNSGDGQRGSMRPRIEEVIVTAQKRQQAIQDVPISMSVMNDEFLVEQGITDIREAVLFAPNIEIESNTTLGGPRCRGFSLNIRNRAFEPPCGVALNGVPYTDATYFTSALFDIERVEILRGPQGTTFGKNTTAGVINLITKDPTDEFSGNFNVQDGELDRKRIELGLGGPIIDGFLNIRVAGVTEERQGYLKNTTAKIVENGVEHPLTMDREAYRVKLEMPDIFGSSLIIGYEDIDQVVYGFGAEAFDVAPDIQAFFRPYDPNADYIKGNFITSMDEPAGPGMLSTIRTLQVEWNVEWLDWAIAAVGAKSDLSRDARGDLDLYPAPVIVGGQRDKNPTDSFELRAFSPLFDGIFGLENIFGWDLGSTELLVGAFYQERKIEDSLLQIEIDGALLLALIALDGDGVDDSPLPPVVTPLPPTAHETVTTTFAQTAETIAAFAELQWYFADNWTLQLGMRESRERKSASWDQNITEPRPVFTAAGWAPFEAEKSRKESQFLPKISFNYKPTDNISLFLRWTRGFKGGGFNAFSLAGEESENTSLTFDSETAREYAFDAKMNFFDDTLRVNLSFFQMDVTDFQYLVQVDDEISGFPAGNTVVNVGEAQSRGVEGDISYFPYDWLTVRATIGYNDTEFVDFPFNSCPQDSPNTDGDDDPRCDVTGEPFPFTPKWNNTLSLNVKPRVSQIVSLFGIESDGYLSELHFEAGVTVEQIDEKFLDETLSQQSLQDGFERYKASIGIGNTVQGWSLRVIGENLTDEVTSVREQEIVGVRANFPEPSRTIYGQFQYTF